MIKVPRLAKGRGYSGPEFYGCCNTGTRPCIFHSREGGYIVGPEMRCRDAMRASIRIYQHSTSNLEGWQKVYFYKGRKAAVHRFMVLCGARILENWEVQQEHDRVYRQAQKGDIGAAIALGLDF